MDAGRLVSVRGRKLRPANRWMRSVGAWLAKTKTRVDESSDDQGCVNEVRGEDEDQRWKDEDEDGFVSPEERRSIACFRARATKSMVEDRSAQKREVAAQHWR